MGGNPAVGPFLRGPARPPEANEAGWKDTVVMRPGQVTRIAVRWAPIYLPVSTAAADLYYPFDPSGEFQHGYVWHCHIIDHEDNEMMRPDIVVAEPRRAGSGGEAAAERNRLLRLVRRFLAFLLPRSRRRIAGGGEALDGR